MKRPNRSAGAALVTALTCVVGLLGSGTARAAEFPYTPANPSAWPGDCVTSGELPWVGNTDVELSVRVDGASDTGGHPAAHFVLWRAGEPGTPVVDTSMTVSAGSTARLRVPREQIPEGVDHWWQVRVENTLGASAWTAPCGFTTDHTPPAAPTVTFTDSAEYPNGAPSGAARTVRFGLPEGTEATGFCFNPERELSTGDCTDQWVPVGPDGTATATFVTPEGSGPMTLSVRAADRAGNISDTVREFYYGARQPLHPFGDHDGDGRADLLGVDAAGRLTLRPGLESGGFGAAVVSDARDWSNAQVKRAGWLVNRFGPQEPNDMRNDIVALRDGRLLAYPGDGAGGFGTAVEIAGHDWSGVTQFALSRSDNWLPLLLAVENGRLLVFDLHASWEGLRVGEPTVLAAGGWSSKTLLASDTNPEALVATFWARDVRAGTLEFFGVDYGSQAPYALREPVTVAASGWAARQMPALVPVGDMTGDDRLDLVTTDRRGGLMLRAVGLDGVPGTPVPLPTSGLGGTRLF